MAKSNGGIIGPDNIPTGPLGTASGVWRLQDATKYQGEGLWPAVTGITYPVANSCRFNDDSSDYLDRTPASAGNQRTWTYSTWVKLANLDLQRSILSAGNTTYYTDLRIDSNNKITFYIDDSVGTYVTTTQVLRDVSSWYHIVVAFDTTQTTSSDRVKIYLNGSQITSFSATSYPALNYQGRINSTDQHSIGRRNASNNHFYDGYLSETYLIDGQALTPSSFGETDSVSGNWKAKAYAGSYGTNGFYLNFQNSGALGTDSSGNANNFTVNNLTSIDQVTDTPTNNFATMNSLIYNNTGGQNYLSEGNLQGYTQSTAYFGGFSSTMGVTSGKWYWEVKLVSTTAGSFYTAIGVTSENYINYISSAARNDTMAGSGMAGAAESYEYLVYNGQKKNNGTGTAYGNTMTTGDIAMVALDLDNNYIYFGKNGTWQNSSDPTSGATGTGAAFTLTDGLLYFPILDLYYDNTTAINFGNPPFTISSGNSDANGFGNFEYAVPTGYYALNTQNINAQG